MCRAGRARASFAPSVGHALVGLAGVRLANQRRRGSARPCSVHYRAAFTPIQRLGATENIAESDVAPDRARRPAAIPADGTGRVGAASRAGRFHEVDHRSGAGDSVGHGLGPHGGGVERGDGPADEHGGSDAPQCQTIQRAAAVRIAPAATESDPRIDAAADMCRRPLTSGRRGLSPPTTAPPSAPRPTAAAARRTPPRSGSSPARSTAAAARAWGSPRSGPG